MRRGSRLERTASVVLLGAMLTASGTVLAQGTTGAQAAPDAVTVAASVQSFYERTQGVRARFYQTYFNRLYDRYERSRGTVVFSKPGKMRWDYDQPNSKVITADGTVVRIYEPGDGNEPGQLFEQAMTGNELSQAFSFLTGTGRLEQSFSFRLLDAARQGFGEGYVLELRPRVASSRYERILFFVAKQDGRPMGVVRRVLIVDEAGNRNRFDFLEMAFNPVVREELFRFEPPAGTRRIAP